MRPLRLTIALVVFLTSGVFAQNNRSAVSVNGNDANSCTVASPCRSFTAAIAVTNDGGEVVALDSAGYGPFVIAKSVTVSGAPGVHAAITTGIANDGILINAPAGHITIRNLVFFGVSASNSGVDQLTAADVYIGDCLFRDYSTGVSISDGDATIERCVIIRMQGVGIDVSGSHRVVIVDCTIQDSDSVGLYVSGHGQVAIVHSTIARVNTGIFANAPMDSGVNAIINAKDCVIAGNALGVSVNSVSGNIAAIYLSDCVINYNNTTVSVAGPGAAVYTYGNNQVNHNNTAGDAMTAATFQ